MTRILIVEDEAHMRMGLADNLEFEGYEVDQAEEGMEGLKKILENEYSLILLDVMLPNMSGFEICKKIRTKGISTPLILLTAKGEEIDKVRGLEMGADDYITKPFSLMELLARVKAVLRRGGMNSSGKTSAMAKIGRLEVDFPSYNAFSDGCQVQMSHKEFEILKYLYEHKNRVVSRDDLLKNIWGYEERVTTRTVDNFILKLRQKIEEDHEHPQVILTVHGTGYKLLG
ncbi:MAG: response regulator transcription factor [Ignavibacteria bacterium]|jgi:DNA-binding response OmpR family regulator|nr:response regulator transcription factor [Ignavibacteria bacterium]MCU7499383.1 response regulator transcription factor [Ignavibacteria bacterium]MCU7513466.1 response regulator transcription factor [Ignavibacteria bacterium]MCU7518916.1 response regulator transcription factor [Ignavibacteria bacterium]MCU7525138.1 response regulator transcription factor [Ignavibacteria bacterium]